MKAAALRRVTEAEAVAAFEKYDRPNGDAHVNIAAELGRLIVKITRFTDFAESRLAALAPDDWASHNPRTAAEVGMFLRALDTARKLLRDVARLGLEERSLDAQRADREATVWAAMRAGKRYSACIARILVALGHEDPRNDPASAVSQVVAREVRRMEEVGDGS